MSKPKTRNSCNTKYNKKKKIGEQILSDQRTIYISMALIDQLLYTYYTNKS